MGSQHNFMYLVRGRGCWGERGRGRWGESHVQMEAETGALRIRTEGQEGRHSRWQTREGPGTGSPQTLQGSTTLLTPGPPELWQNKHPLFTRPPCLWWFAMKALGERDITQPNSFNLWKNHRTRKSHSALANWLRGQSISPCT